MSDSLQPHGLYPAVLLCPRDSPGKSTGVSSHFLLQETFLSLGFNLRLWHLLHGQVDSLPLAPPEGPLSFSPFVYCLPYHF